LFTDIVGKVYITITKFLLYSVINNELLFTARQQGAVLAIVNPSVRLSVCHTLVLCQNDSNYDLAVFTGE